MTFKNKRKHQRFKTLNLSYICLDENQNIVKQGMGRTLNISESGILLETHFPIEFKHTVQLTLSLEEDLLDITGKPIHAKSTGAGRYEIGIQFFELDQNTNRVIKKFINFVGTQKATTVEEKE